MRWNEILFDLDGTLTDPALGITNAIIYARKKWGMDPGKNEDFYPFIGPPMPQSFTDYWGMDPEDARRFLDDYREYFGEIGLFENTPYPGIVPLLAGLKDRGARLYVATTKPTPFSERIVEKFGMAEYFELVSGSCFDGTRGNKADVIAYARDTCHIDMSRAVLIGDRMHDAEGAALCGIPCIGVSYGYGGRAELEAAGCLHVVDSVAELEEYLLQ